MLHITCPLKDRQPFIFSNGTKAWTNSIGERHRLDGPAIEWIDGSKFWYKNNRLYIEML